MHLAPVVRSLVVALVTICATAQAGTIYVSTTGNDARDGFAWATAKKTVQAGLNAAAAGDQIWVAAGTYVERISLKTGVALYGGFAGTETELIQRNWAVNRTILDGNRGGTVVKAYAVSATTRIDGFTIRNGKASDGGGIDCRYGSGLITNNTISSNTASDCGSGIFCSGCSPTITNNAITANGGPAWPGGGIGCLGASPTIANNIINGNVAATGAGIWCSGSSAPVILGNTIVGNDAPPTGGGAIYCANGSPAISHSIIAFNSSGIVKTGGTPSLAYNCVYGNSGGNYSGLADPTGSNGNISVDPKLARPLRGNYHIQADSPCVDAGDPAFTADPGQIDIDGQSRIAGNRVDIGADESDGTTWSADADNVIRVSPQGDDNNDGSSWASAKRTVQGAISAVPVWPGGGEVWVAAGTYFENITVKAGIALYGGFGGDETELTQRDPTNHTTVLDGNSTGTVVTIFDGATTGTRVDGFIVRKGSGLGYTVGGGIWCSGSSPTITNNTIIRNTSWGAGGGIRCDSASPIIANNVIAGNDGGGVYCGSSSPTIANNTIVRNFVNNFGGGGIYCSNSSPVIVNTIIAYNAAGVTNTGSGVPSLSHNCVYGNTNGNYSGLTDPTGTNGNMASDPKLAQPYYANIHLQPDSPCRNAGDGSVVQAGWVDIDGQPRVADGQVDIGADESDGTVWPSAVNPVVYVRPDGDDAKDGSSWLNARRTVQGGVNAAAAYQGGAAVWVAAGTYVENVNQPADVALYGGFVGSETQLSQRNWSANVTILDGNQKAGVVMISGGQPSSTRVDGFTIRNGKADGGGGIYCYMCSPTITNNMITGNSATYSGGGGIQCYYPGSAVIVNNIITGNSSSAAGLGGGIYCRNSSPIIANNFITNNSGFGDGTYGVGSGGGICCTDGAAPTIANNTIAGNSAVEGGGVYCKASSPTILNTIIAFNSSGIYLLGTAGGMTLRYNCVYGNIAFDYSGLSDPTGTDGNIAADPRLADVAYGYVHIQPGSPCINAGDDTAVQAGWKDIDGQERILGAAVDIGADESDGSVWPSGPNVIVRVATDGNDANNGSSWLQPKRTVQAGIDAAAAAGGEVWVKAGTYAERIVLRNRAHLYGGFAGTEVERQARNWSQNITILDGGQHGSVVTADLINLQLCTLDGFTLCNGSGPEGGGIYCYRSALTIVNNTIRDNRAGFGGGILCRMSVPLLANNTIAGNTAFYNCGGGIYCENSFPLVENNSITSNSTSGSSSARPRGGGGIYCYGSSPCIRGNLITDNTVTGDGSYNLVVGGGIFCAARSSPTIAGNTINSNTAESGGGIYCVDSGAFANPSIANNTIRGNRAVRGSGGAIVCSSYSSATIQDNMIVANSASESGGAISCAYASITGNTITANTADSGGGIISSSAVIRANRIIGNSATSYGGGILSGSDASTIADNVISCNSAESGGGIHCGLYGDWPAMSGNTITGNTATYGGGVWVLGGASYTPPSITGTIIAFNSSGIYVSGSGSPTLKYNCVYGNTAYDYSGITNPTGSNGNIASDPSLIRLPFAGSDDAWGTADDDYGDQHLLAGSGCFNAGDPAYVPVEGETDLDGQPRVLYGRVDIGADEYQFAGDCNFDGFVNVADLQALVTCWASSRATGGSYSVGADLNNDGYVNVGDLQLLVANWGKSL